jgi:methylated-DNA-protein-cysteine methyltransferase-like protein
MSPRPRRAPLRRRQRADASAGAPKFARAVYALVRDVPRGTVVTYGQVAAILGHPRAARAVGTALHHLPRPLARVVPWQRVVNAAGRISIRGDVVRPDLQRDLLESEGIVFRGGRIDLGTYRWKGPRRERRVRLAVGVPFDRDSPALRRVRRSQNPANRR